MTKVAKETQRSDLRTGILVPLRFVCDLLSIELLFCIKNSNTLKDSYFSNSAAPWTMGRFLQILGNTFLVEQLYGSKYSPHIGKFYLPYVYVKAMLYAAGADELATSERQYIQGLAEILLPVNDAQCIETRLEVVQFIEAVPQGKSNENISSFLSGSMLTSPVLSRVLIYDAVRAASADGVYSLQEQEHVHRVCKQLGISENVRMRIEAISEKENILADRKKKLFSRLL